MSLTFQSRARPDACAGASILSRILALLGAAPTTSVKTTTQALTVTADVDSTPSVVVLNQKL